MNKPPTMNMTKAYRILFLYIPSMMVALFLALMMIPGSVFNPWVYLNIWTVFQAFALSYMVLGFISMAMRRSAIGLHLVLIGVTMGVLAIGLCWLGFGSLHYMFGLSHAPALVVIFSVLILGGFLVIRRRELGPTEVGAP